MQVEVSTFYQDSALGLQKEVRVTLTEDDAKDMLPSVDWDSISTESKALKMVGMADILTIRYGIMRGFRDLEAANGDILKIVKGISQ